MTSTRDEVLKFLERSRLTQREILKTLREGWLAGLRALSDEDLLPVLHQIRKTLNSKKLVAERDALLGELRRDGQAGGAALPKPVVPAALAAPVEVVPDPGQAVTRPGRHPELEAAIEADPDAREAYLVYGDWLEAQGDPRGKLIAIQHELGKRKGDHALLRAQGELLAAERARLLGPLADCDDLLLEVEWHLGFIRRCKVRTSLDRHEGDRDRSMTVERVLHHLLDDPGPGRFLQQLTVGLVTFEDNSYQGVAERLSAYLRPTLRGLFLGDFGYEETELNWSTIGDLSCLWPAVPRLEKLTLRSGSMTLGAIELPELRELTTITGGLGSDSVRAIAGASWPRLERLALQIGRVGEGATGDAGDLAPLLEARAVPRLRHLGIMNCELTDELCDRLPGSKVLPQLTGLDLSMGTMSDAGAELLVAQRSALAHLELLDVSDNYLSARGIALLEEAFPESLVVGEQRDDGGDPRNRYASAFE
jgi:uncharacterized protein (TIGR02996 family)